MTEKTAEQIAAEAAAKKAADKKAKDELAEKKRLEKTAAAEAAKAAKAAEKQPDQNGIVRPKANTNCGKIWALADSLSKKAGAPVTIKALAEIAEAEGYNHATIKTQYARWRKFHGVTGRIVDPAKPVTETAAETATTEGSQAAE